MCVSYNCVLPITAGQWPTKQHNSSMDGSTSSRLAMHLGCQWTIRTLGRQPCRLRGSRTNSSSSSLQDNYSSSNNSLGNSRCSRRSSRTRRGASQLALQAAFHKLTPCRNVPAAAVLAFQR